MQEAPEWRTMQESVTKNPRGLVGDHVETLLRTLLHMTLDRPTQISGFMKLKLRDCAPAAAWVERVRDTPGLGISR
jgi:hypothetical protein